MTFRDLSVAVAAIEEAFGVTVTDPEKELLDAAIYAVFRALRRGPASDDHRDAVKRVSDLAYELEKAITSVARLAADGPTIEEVGKSGKATPKSNPARWLLDRFDPEIPIGALGPNQPTLEQTKNAIQQLREIATEELAAVPQLKHGHGTEHRGYVEFARRAWFAFDTIAKRAPRRRSFATFLARLELAAPENWRLRDPAKIKYQIAKAIPKASKG